ncbi:MAG: SCO family protein [Cocleimonas sp.]|nr:SCO family protein [Cocleimonas sp.]
MKIILPLAVIAFILGISLGLTYFDVDKNNGNNKGLNASQMNYPAGGNFTLHEGDKSVSLSDYDGKIRFIFFGYTSCPDICPTSLAFVSSSLKQLTPKELAQVKVFFISVDPDRDNVEKLHDYTKYFHPNIVGVTGTKSEIDEVVKKYGAAYRKVKSDSAMGYLVDHSASIYVVGKNGKVVDMLPHGLPVEAITKTIRQLL